MESGVASDEMSRDRWLRIGAAVWLAIALLQLVLHGISLDETATAAPIINGAIQYPAGHPHDAFYRSTYSLLQYIAAGLWYVYPDAFGISALYNVLFLFISAFAPFALALVLTERPMWAWVAGALALTEAAIPFDGLYPLYVYPFPFSNGHIGTHLIVLVVAMALARRWGATGFLLGIFPAVHGTLALIAWLWAGLWLLGSVNRPHGADRRRALLSLGAGLAICAVLALVIAARGVASPLPPYVAADDALVIYRQFTAHSDLHRQTPVLASFGYLVNPIAFFLLGALTIALRGSLASSEESARQVRAVLDLGVVAWALILIAYVYRRVFGVLPLPLEIAMPFRLANVTALLLLPLTVAAAASVVERLQTARRSILPALIAGALIVGALYSIRNPPLVSEHLLIAIWGVILGVVLDAFTGRPRTIALVLSLLLVASFILAKAGARPVMAFLAPLAATAALFAISTRLAGTRERAPVMAMSRVRGAVLGVCAIAVLLGVWRRGGDDPTGPVDHTWRRMNPDDRALRSWAAVHTRPNEPLLAPIWPYAKVQAKLARPQLVEWETMYLMTYAPRRAAVINQLARDVYGVNYADAEALSHLCGGGFIGIWCDEWKDSWQRRKRSEWVALGRKYSVRHLLAPNEWPIDLPRDTTVGRWTMYRIP